MALTDTFVRLVKPGKPGGEKHTDGAGMYLLVKETGKYWRMNYRFLGKRKTLALGVYPEVSLATARKRRDEARTLLAEGIDPSLAKQEQRQAKSAAALQTFEAVAKQWMEKIAPTRTASTQGKVQRWLDQNLIPVIGKKPIADIKPRDVLAAMQKMEARGAVESAHRVKQLCGQIFRFAVALDLVERDITVDLRGALAPTVRRNFSAITEPKQVGALMRAIYDYHGFPAVVAALKLAPLVFVRPGELRAAEWTEFDLDAAEWRIPAAKMKMKIEHLVPLSKQAVDILRGLYPITGDGRYVFPSLRSKACMSENTINARLALHGLQQGSHDRPRLSRHGENHSG
jgi:integrase